MVIKNLFPADLALEAARILLCPHDNAHRGITPLEEPDGLVDFQTMGPGVKDDEVEMLALHLFEGLDGVLDHKCGDCIGAEKVVQLLRNALVWICDDETIHDIKPNDSSFALNRSNSMPQTGIRSDRILH